MGDRANIRLVYRNDASVYLYTHWGGSELSDTLKSALKRGKSRWGDESYLARIIFSEMIQQDVLDTTGFGIDVIPAGDANHPCITVFLDEDAVDSGLGKQTFQEYCK
jgi:hypothetical protein